MTRMVLKSKGTFGGICSIARSPYTDDPSGAEINEPPRGIEYLLSKFACGGPEPISLTCCVTVQLRF